MAYVLRKRTKEDVEFFLENGVTSPWGGIPGFDYSLVECPEENIKMIFIGGQGIMNEYGIEWSEMAHYAAVVSNEKSYTIEFFSYNKYSKIEETSKRYETIYKLKVIYSFNGTDYEKEIFLDKVKKCFTEYAKEDSEKYICDKVIFLDEELRWM